MDKNGTRALLERHGIILKKALGQNFLTDMRVPERIAEEVGIDRTHGVLEIGPGSGALTAELCKRAGRVVAVEIDRRMIPLLDDALGGCDNLAVIEGDALKVDFAALVESELGGLVPLACANLPYYITSPLIERLLESRLFEKCCVMVQREVAQRICAKPGTSSYSSFSVYCSYYSTPTILFGVPSSSFVPRPTVDSAVVMFERRDPQTLEPHDTKMFFRTLRSAFAERRKTLQNNLAREFGVDKPTLAEMIVSLGHPADVRGERLGLDNFLRLSNLLAKKI